MMRILFRGIGLLALILCALADFVLRISFCKRSRLAHARARWLHCWCRLCCKLIGLRIHFRGTVPRSGLLVANHLSYLDIIALSAVTPCVFVAKKDIASWPIFGLLAEKAGTLFIDRTRRSDVGRLTCELEKALRNNLLVVLFPEGTSSDGTAVLPFKSSLLEPVLTLGCNISAAAIHYSLDGNGSVANEVCYWRDMTLLPHLLNLLSKKHIVGLLTFHAQIGMPVGVKRKELALQLRERVLALRAGHDLSATVTENVARRTAPRWDFPLCASK